uniref:Uncharacterized protein n=1 Tax=Sphaerodactylus townsendi TaxID=933632 RepID=A0ACB8GB11_9SAUR
MAVQRGPREVGEAGQTTNDFPTRRPQKSNAGVATMKARLMEAPALHLPDPERLRPLHGGRAKLMVRNSRSVLTQPSSMGPRVIAYFNKRLDDTASESWPVCLLRQWQVAALLAKEAQKFAAEIYQDPLSTLHQNRFTEVALKPVWLTRPV